MTDKDEEKRKKLALNTARWRAKNPEKAREKNRQNANRYRLENPELHALRVYQWRKANPDKAKAIRKRWLERNKEFNKIVQKKSQLKYLYGLTIEQYEEMCKLQNYECSICNKKVKLVVDHCHETGNMRGLLCTKCNKALGGFEDHIGYLMAAIDYIRNSWR